jgi:phosphatidylglycerophosphatase A
VQKLAVALATVGPIGRVPVAPGTAGTLVALPLLPGLAALRARSLVASVAAVVALVLIAVWAAGHAEDGVGAHDPSSTVIDEVAGLVVAGLFAPGTWTAYVLTFALFRLFDVVKPFPAGRIDRRWPGGLGVVGDDVVAGVYAGIAARLVLAAV